MLAFNTNTQRCKQLFTELFKTIEDSELEHYPYHYDILEYKDELYTKYKEKRQQYIESIKVGKTNDAYTVMQEKVDRYDKNLKDNIIKILFNIIKVVSIMWNAVIQMIHSKNFK